MAFQAAQYLELESVQYVVDIARSAYEQVVAVSGECKRSKCDPRITRVNQWGMRKWRL